VNDESSTKLVYIESRINLPYSYQICATSPTDIVYS